MLTQLKFLTSYLQARFTSDEKGAALVEYALLVALIAVASIVILGLLGVGISNMFDRVNDKISTAGA
ncbi:MAG: Flp family type IVb pilin [Actinomycetota bacterium]|jgi:pilus assembly protein Flp/PilA|nr:Flp family type IVb pilin [Actinomycetota bacterium]